MRTPCLALAALLVVAIAGCAWPGRLLRGYADGRPVGLAEALATSEAEHHRVAAGLSRFVFEDWGSLNTDGLDYYTLPWKVVTAGIVLRAHDEEGAEIGLETLEATLRGVGFVRPSSIRNWPGTQQPSLDGPIGLVRGTLSRGFPSVELEAANVGCAGCHSGVLYDERGEATRDVWLGLPNTSINLEAYVLTIFRGLEHVQGREDRFWEVLDTLYPATSEKERSTIRKHVLPRIRERFEGDWEGRRSPLVFVNGSAGLTNGVASIKSLIGMLGEDETETEVAFTSIPDLGGTLLRSSLLYDGTYAAQGMPRFRPVALADVDDAHRDAIADITTFFVVPTLGVKPENARDAFEGVREVIRALETLRAPPYPGPVDADLAREGERIYADACASCHGVFSEGLDDVRLVSYPNALSPQATIGTDPRRWELASADFAERIEETEYGRYLSVATTGGYVAPPLTALWATAPYLHNGSVPTLWHLMNPSERPERFMVGGHRLDFERVGIAGATDASGTYRYPADHSPWSTPALYDTSEPGRSRAGHESPFNGLTAEQKRALIEYLKLL